MPFATVPLRESQLRPLNPTSRVTTASVIRVHIVLQRRLRDTAALTKRELSNPLDFKCRKPEAPVLAKPTDAPSSGPPATHHRRDRQPRHRHRPPPTSGCEQCPETPANYVQNSDTITSRREPRSAACTGFRSRRFIQRVRTSRLTSVDRMLTRVRRRHRTSRLGCTRMTATAENCPSIDGRKLTPLLEGPPRVVVGHGPLLDGELRRGHKQQDISPQFPDLRSEVRLGTADPRQPAVLDPHPHAAQLADPNRRSAPPARERCSAARRRAIPSRACRRRRSASRSERRPSTRSRCVRVSTP